jgi:AP-4 complex subunit mu-1
VILKEDYLPSYPSLSIPSKPVKTSESKEEVFIDVIEKVTALFNSHGFLLNGNIDGCIKLRSFLKGKPEVEIGLSSYFDRQITLNTELKNFNFHSKVDYSRFCQDKVLTVDPPLGEIIVMNYRILEQVDTPFKVFPYVEKINSYKYEILVKIKSMFSNKLTASIVKATFHVPKVTASVIIEHLKKTKGQKSFFDKTLKKVVWEIEEFKGSKEITFKAVVSLDSALLHKPVLKQVSLKFEISGYSTSGMSIKYFKTLEQKQKDITKWIRYSTNSSSYICRINS